MIEKTFKNRNLDTQCWKLRVNLENATKFKSLLKEIVSELHGMHSEADFRMILKYLDPHHHEFSEKMTRLNKKIDLLYIPNKQS